MIAACPEQTVTRFHEFFTANIRNPTTRKASPALPSLSSLVRRSGCDRPLRHPAHLAGWIEELGRTHSVPTVKQRLAAIRHLFDWMVVGQAMPSYPAHTVRAPKFSSRTGKTPVLSPQEARQLLDSTPVGTVIGLLDRALIGLMTYSFARIGAAIGTGVRAKPAAVGAVARGRGKRHEMPCHHSLEQYLVAYLDAGGLRDHPCSPLFRTIGRGTGHLSETPSPSATPSPWSAGGAPTPASKR